MYSWQLPLGFAWIYQENAKNTKARFGYCTQKNEGACQITKATKQPYILGDFLEEENIAAEVNAIAIKRVIAWQVEEAMKIEHMTKKTMAEKIHTSRSQLDHLQALPLSCFVKPQKPLVGN